MASRRARRMARASGASGRVSLLVFRSFHLTPGKPGTESRHCSLLCIARQNVSAARQGLSRFRRLASRRARRAGPYIILDSGFTIYGATTLPAAGQAASGAEGGIQKGGSAGGLVFDQDSSLGFKFHRGAAGAPRGSDHDPLIYRRSRE